MSDAPTSSATFANHTLAYLRQIDKRLEQQNELLGRQNLRLDRIERDVREIRSDIVTMENSILNRMNEIYDISHRLTEHIEQAGMVEVPTLKPRTGSMS